MHGREDKRSSSEERREKLYGGVRGRSLEREEERTLREWEKIQTQGDRGGKREREILKRKGSLESERDCGRGHERERNRARE